MAPHSSEVVTGDVSGGTNTSRPMVVGGLMVLLDAVPAGAPPAVHALAALDADVLEPDTSAWPLPSGTRPDWINTPAPRSEVQSRHRSSRDSAAPMPRQIAG